MTCWWTTSYPRYMDSSKPSQPATPESCYCYLAIRILTEWGTEYVSGPSTSLGFVQTNNMQLSNWEYSKLLLKYLCYIGHLNVTGSNSFEAFAHIQSQIIIATQHNSIPNYFGQSVMMSWHSLSTCHYSCPIAWVKSLNKLHSCLAYLALHLPPCTRSMIFFNSSRPLSFPFPSTPLSPSSLFFLPFPPFPLLISPPPLSLFSSPLNY